MTQPCPPTSQLERLLLDQLDADQDNVLTRHIEGCPSCQAVLDQLSRGGDPSGSSPSLEDTPDAPEGVIRRLKEHRPAHGRRQPTDTGPTTPTETAALPHLPGYEILEEVGRGGMGVIYRARQIPLDRLVAVKMLRPGAQTSATALARLRGEASVIARLHHPNIVQIHEVGDHAGHPYLSLEFMEGGSLRQRLDGKPRPAYDAATLLEIVARAVDAAHSRGVIHRDIKPANILFERDSTGGSSRDRPRADRGPPSDGRNAENLWSKDVPKVADFGLAKLLDSEAASGGPLTHSGEVVGTPNYMAPEQAQGKGVVGPATDVYALGAVLYEMLTGRPPFVAETSLGTLLRVVHDEPISVTRLCPSVPRDLATIAMKCLEKEPARRYATAGALADDLARFTAGQTVLARPLGRIGRGWRWCRRNPVVAALLAALAVVFAVGFGVALWEAQVARANAQAEAQARDEADRQTELAIARKEQAMLLRRQAERVAALSIFDQALARCRQGDISLGLLLLVDSWEKAERAGADDLPFLIRANLSAWSRRLPGGRDRRARLWDAATGQLRLDWPHAESVTAAAFSPDGRRVLTGCVDHTVRLWDANNGRRLGNVTISPFPITAVAFHPSLPLLAIASGSLNPALSGQQRFGRGETRLWDATTLRPLGAPLSDTFALALAFSSNGRSLLTASADGRARLTDVSRLHPRPLAIHAASEVRWVRFSPDGQALLTASAPSASGSLWGDMRLWDAANGKPLESPVPAHTFDRDGINFLIHFSPDGKTVLNYHPDGTVLLRDAATGRLLGPPPAGHVNAPPHGHHAVFSSDGKQLCILSAGDARLWDAASNKPIGPPLRHEGGITVAAFHPDGKSLFTVGGDGVLCRWDLATRRRLAKPLPHPSGSIKDLVFAPDGRSFLTADSANTVWQWQTEGGGEIAPSFSLGKEEGVAAFHLFSYSPDGQYIMADLGHALLLWDKTTGQRVASLRKTGQAWSSGGEWLALIAGNVWVRVEGEVRLWHSQRRAFRWATPLGNCRCLDLRADGRIVATGNDESVWFWDVATGKPIGPPLDHPLPLLALHFDTDGRRLLTCCGDDTARIWEVPQPMQGSRERVKRWIEQQTGKTLDEVGASRP